MTATLCINYNKMSDLTFDIWLLTALHFTPFPLPCSTFGQADKKAQMFSPLTPVAVSNYANPCHHAENPCINDQKISSSSPFPVIWNHFWASLRGLPYWPRTTSLPYVCGVITLKPKSRFLWGSILIWQNGCNSCRREQGEICTKAQKYEVSWYLGELKVQPHWSKHEV